MARNTIDQGLKLRRAVLCYCVLAATLMSCGAVISEEVQVDPQRVVVLVERINEYHRLFRDRNYRDAYEMQGSQWKEGSEDKKEWISACRRMDNGIKLLDWWVKTIWIAGDRAKVRIATEVKTRATLFSWEQGVEEEDHFWFFEDNNWFYIPLKLDDWDDSKAVEVRVPRPPPKAEIKVKP
jgi:hypothetical protein